MVQPEDRGALARAASVGIEISASVIVCLLVGHWADGKLGTSPWLTLLGILLGTAVALKAVLRMTKQSEEQK